MGWTVAYAYRDRPTQYVGFNVDRKVIERYAREGRAGWKDSKMADYAPTSIRIRQMTYADWLLRESRTNEVPRGHRVSA